MSIQANLFYYIHLWTSIIALLSGINLWLFSAKISSPVKWLSVALICLSVYQWTIFVVESRLIFPAFHLFKAGNIFGLIFITLSYFYIRSSIFRSRPGWKDVIHFLPALFVLIDLAPLYLLPSLTKMNGLNLDLTTLNTLLNVNIGFLLPNGFYLMLMTGVFAFYWLAQMKHLTNLHSYNFVALVKDRSPWIRWLMVYLVVEIFVFLPFFIAFFFNNSPWTIMEANMVSSAALAFLPLVSLFLLKPEIRNVAKNPEPEIIELSDPGKSEREYECESEDLPCTDTDEDSQNLDPETIKEIRSKLDICMGEESVYLIHGYTLSHLANDIGYPYYQISLVINNQFGMNFNDYINRYRVEFCKEEMCDEKWHNLTLEAIAFECGFNNRNSFTIAFKKFTGKTPSTYLTSVKKQVKAQKIAD